MSGTRITNALVRQISRSLPECALVHLPRPQLDLALAKQQHAEYVAALKSAGAQVTVLPEEPDLPDAAFVEDPVVVLDEIAIIGQPGTPSREPEADAIAPAISQFRPIQRITLPGTLEGGDVLRIGRTLFVGNSSRTNADGIRQLKEIVRPFDYQVIAVAIQGCLHLKTAVTSPTDGLVVANSAWVDLSAFRDLEVLSVPRAEPWGANTLAVNGKVLVASSAPETAHLLEARGLSIQNLDISELQKAEAGLTCLSVLF